MGPILMTQKRTIILITTQYGTHTNDPKKDHNFDNHPIWEFPLVWYGTWYVGYP